MLALGQHIYLDKRNKYTFLRLRLLIFHALHVLLGTLKFYPRHLILHIQGGEIFLALMIGILETINIEKQLNLFIFEINTILYFFK